MTEGHGSLGGASFDTPDARTRTDKPWRERPPTPRVGLPARASGGVAHARVCAESRTQTRTCGRHRAPPGLVAHSIDLFEPEALASACAFEAPPAGGFLVTPGGAVPAEDDLPSRGRPEGRPRPHAGCPHLVCAPG